ncbi:MAG: DnaB-like helicase C-terminal domain-containing protein [Syntrophorhabdaceae bacterium]|nr:DnaB-like helicase C-terminal domain-containing protein [Syntrophorhabdaceae bacterium]
MALAEQIEREQALVKYDGEDRVLPAVEVLKLYRAEVPKGEKIMSKIPTLDRVLDGFYPGQLIVISGVTGHGKTTIAQTFTKNMSEQLVYPLWFSYEVGTDDFLSTFSDDHQKYIYMPAKLKGNTLKWLEDRILESKLKYRTQAVFIDHIHYLVTMSPKQNMSYIIGETVRGLKQLCIKHNIVIFLIAHMTKTRPEEEPGLGHTRDSSFIEQEADSVLYVWRHVKDRWITILKVAKNRKRGIIDDRIALILRDGKYEETTAMEE